ncbi:LLM class flavin-dependent oxidoreductase [Microbacterium elymi]|uniref:LLM class flavin-dependent oxidoreductase n=1 Tax=Microbacterium elymi TaxID=2909587 RepID=A0ABY5NKH0_9MICO|nr:LLM class flavin-dependent oxidoreductase [Microbacterium elymi]UUT35655.1 LLM class flavin-dependent oxidoreductase [Microbacterium elymi]
MLLGYAAALTRRITLGTGIVTLPLDHPLRVAEDAAVLARLSGGRFELGVGSGGTPSAFAPFDQDPGSAPRSTRIICAGWTRRWPGPR